MLRTNTVQNTEQVFLMDIITCFSWICIHGIGEFFFFSIYCSISGTPLQCGETSPPRQARVMGGQRSEPGQWPWLCHIRIYVHGSTFIRCAATIIHRRWLTTASSLFEYKLVVIEFLDLFEMSGTTTEKMYVGT